MDKEFIQGYYEALSDQEFTRLLIQNTTGFTPEALEVVQKEIEKRNLDPLIFTLAEEQQPDAGSERTPNPNGCPVDEPIRIWLEQSFLYLLGIFGEEETQSRQVLTPDKIHFPIRYDGSERAAYETLQIVAKQMEVPVENITLDFYDETLRRITKDTPGGMYWGRGGNDSFEISLARIKLDEPENMVATMAHEIAHVKLLGENRMQENNEPLTDLATIFFGLGIFNANAAFQTFADSKYYGWSSSGYLTQMEWGYALSLFAFIRGETQPDWANHLCRNVKGDFIKGIAFLSANEDLIFQEE